MLRIEEPVFVSRVQAAVAAPSRRTLSGSRSLDFLLTGGLSLMVWLVIMIGEGRWAWIDPVTAAFPAAALLLANFINHPHFMISYKLAYSRGAGFLRQNVLQLVLVPLVLVVLPAIGFVFGEQNPQTGAVARFLAPAFSILGAPMQPGRYASLSQATLALLITGMYFSVGWHYAKQTFGAMMVLGQFDGYTLLPWQRLIVRYSLLATWWTTWISGQVGFAPYSYYSLTLFRLNLPHALYIASMWVTWTLAAAFWILVIVRNARRSGHLPSINFITPWVALFIWHLPPFRHPEFFYVIALFHSLQYMPFVYKIEKTRLAQNVAGSSLWIRLGGITILMILTGYLSFHFFPETLDPLLGTRARFGMEYVLIATLAFINIHHYFIDNVIWRFKDGRVKQWLLAG